MQGILNFLHQHITRFATTCVIKPKHSARYTPSAPLSRRFSLTRRNDLRLVQFNYVGECCGTRVGYIDACCCVVELNCLDPCLPCTILEILQQGQLGRVKKLACIAAEGTPLCGVNLKAPIHGVDKVLCIGLNYSDHCQVHNLMQPKAPMVFSKFASTIVGPNECLRIRTGIVEQVDYEVELCVVMGIKASDIKARDAFSYIMGYTIAQDISARDWQKEKNSGQFLLGKSQDTFCPLGPCIVTSDEIGDPQKLEILCSVNGVVKQCSTTSNMLFTIPEIIERLTSVMTLLPGDIILTGTPAGVGMYSKPPEFLKPGDVICSQIQNIGSFKTIVQRF